MDETPQPEEEKAAIVQVVDELVELILYDSKAERTQQEETSATESQVVQVDETPQPEEEKAAIVQLGAELVELILYDSKAESTQQEETSAAESQVVHVDETPEPEEEKAAIVQVVGELVELNLYDSVLPVATDQSLPTDERIDEVAETQNQIAIKINLLKRFKKNV